LLIARYPDEQADMVGMLTLIIYRVPFGVRARIEDVVVDAAMRGKGIGEALTSNPKREAANRLYQRLGFKHWQTNIYFYEL